MNHLKKAFFIVLFLALVFSMLPTLESFAETTGNEDAKLVLNLESVQLAKDKKVKLTVTPEGEGLPSKLTYKWQSTDKKIATVANGVVTGVKAGTTTVTVSLKVNETLTLSASCEVIVYIPVTKISAKTPSVTVNVGSSHSPAVTFAPKTATYQKLVWKSDNETVATVNERGQIKGVKPGECVVTATTTDGGNKSLSIKVFVPTLSTNTKEVLLDWPFTPKTVIVKYYSNARNITLDDKQAKNNFYFESFKDGTLTLRIWPWMTGNGTLTISDSTSPKSTLKIKITTHSFAGLNNRDAAFQNINLYYKELMRYGPEGCGDYFYVKARVMQAYSDNKNAWVLAYSRGKYDDLVYIEFPNDVKHAWLQGSNMRLQEDDVIHVWVKPVSIYSYETTMGATNYALKLKPYLIFFDDGSLFYVDKDIYK